MNKVRDEVGHNILPDILLQPAFLIFLLFFSLSFSLVPINCRPDKGQGLNW